MLGQLPKVSFRKASTQDRWENVLCTIVATSGGQQGQGSQGSLNPLSKNKRLFVKTAQYAADANPCSFL